MSKLKFLIVILLLIHPLYAQQRINIDFKDADIKDVLRAIGLQVRVNVIALPEVEGRVTVHLADLEIEDALDAVLKTKGFKWRKNKEVYEIYAPGEKDTADETKLLIERNGDTIDIIVKNIEVSKFFEELSEKTDMNFILDDTIKGKIKVYLKNVTVDNAIENILLGNNYSYIKKENIYRITKSDKKKEFPPKLDISVEDGKVSLDILSADIGYLLKDIAEQSGIDIILYGTVTGKIEKMKLTDIPIDEIFQKLLEGTKYSILKEDNIYIAAPTTGNEASVMVKKLKVFKIKNLKVNEVIKKLPSYVDAGSIKTFPEHNLFTIEASPSTIKRLSEYIETIDKPAPVVMIEARIVDYNVDFSQNRSLGAKVLGSGGEITLGPGTLSLQDMKMKQLGDFDQFQATLESLISEGKADVKASPKIATISGKEAVINVALQEHFKVTTGNVETPLTHIEKISSGIMLKIKPYVSSESDNILVEIFAKVSSPGSVSTDGIPAVNTRDAKTEMTIKNGETIVIAGMIQDRKSESENRTPLLGKIPLLNYFFKKKVKSSSKSELVFYITPRIVKSEASDIKH